MEITHTHPIYKSEEDRLMSLKDTKRFCLTLLAAHRCKGGKRKSV